MIQKLRLQELNRLSVDEFKRSDKIPLVLVLDDIRSGMNVGSMFRTADAVALRHIILTGISPIPPHKEIHKTAIGATESVHWKYEKDVVSAIEDLRNQEYLIVGVEQTNRSIPLSQFKLDEMSGHPVALVMGNEVNGLNSQILPLLDVALEIEQYGTKHSLNVAVCAGIAMWEISRQMRLDQ